MNSTLGTTLGIHVAHSMPTCMHVTWIVLSVFNAHVSSQLHSLNDLSEPCLVRNMHIALYYVCSRYRRAPPTCRITLHAAR